MGTRATIKVEGIDFAKVYKHYDGYPSATLAWLESFNKRFAEKRGDDPQYKIAQLLRDSIMNTSFDLDRSAFTGWGIVPFMGDNGEEFEYLLKKDGSVEVKEVV